MCIQGFVMQAYWLIDNDMPIFNECLTVNMRECVCIKSLAIVDVSALIMLL